MMDTPNHRFSLAVAFRITTIATPLTLTLLLLLLSANVLAVPLEFEFQEDVFTITAADNNLLAGGDDGDDTGPLPGSSAPSPRLPPGPRLYVGGNDVVFMLSEDLRLLGTKRLDRCQRDPSGESRNGDGGSSGSSDDDDPVRAACENRVVVLEVDRTFRRLLACGAGSSDSNNGGGGGCGGGSLWCWILGLKDLAVHGRFKTPFHADGCHRHAATRPILFRQVQEEGGKGEASRRQRILRRKQRQRQPQRRSRWIVASPYPSPSSKAILSEMNITEHLITATSSSDQATASYSKHVERGIAKCNDSFRFDISDGFCHGSGCFFLTLQQRDASSSAAEDDLISRMASVPTNSSSLLPYVEISFNTTIGDFGVYNRALMLTLGEIDFVGRNTVESVAVSVFGNASSPTPGDEARPSTRGFGIALSLLTDLEKHRKKTIQETVDGDKDSTPDWNYGPNCSPVYPPNACANCSSKLVIQNDRGDSVRLYSNGSSHDEDDDDISHVTSLFTHTQKRKGENRPDNRMTIYVTMSTGRIHKFSVLVQDSGVFITTRVKHLSGDYVQRTNRRRAVAIAGENFYLLSGSKVEGRPLDYCQPVGACEMCAEVDGCTWCESISTCVLNAKCPSNDGKACPPSIHRFIPASGPAVGGTMLNISGTNLRTYNAKVFICGEECNKKSSEEHWMMCTVPESVKKAKRHCPLMVHMPAVLQANYSELNLTAAQDFHYTIPEVRKFTPHKLLQSEGGDIVFRGENLDTGSNASVTLSSEHGPTIKCQLTERKRDLIRCHVANMTSRQQETAGADDEGDDDDDEDGSVTSFANVTKAERQTLCYNVTLTIDKYNLTSPGESPLLCLHPNPALFSLDRDSTFVGGSVALTVKGSDLDFANVRLRFIVNGSESQSRPCALCPGITNGTCVVCCSPDVTTLTTSPFRDDVRANVRFVTTSKQTREVLEDDAGSLERNTVRLIRDPEFHFADLDKNRCAVVNGDGTLKLKANFLPASVLYSVMVHTRIIPQCFLSRSGDITPSSPSTITCNLAPLRDQHSHDGDSNSNDAILTCGGGGGVGADDDRDEYDHVHKGVVRVLVYGRPFTVGCVDFAPLFTGSKQTLPQWYIIAAGAGGFLLLLVIILSCYGYFRYRKRQFEKNRYYHTQHSAASDGTLLHSESGSAEPVYVSVERVLNPTGNHKKRKEIQNSGLIIQRKHLILGDVIGHGNFGCVFEGQYQTKDGDESSWKVVAVKTLLDPTIHAIDIKSFIDEAMLMKQFDHEHVMSLLGLSDGDRGPLVVLPYMDRGDLLVYVKNESTVLSIGDVLKFAKDIASGMDYLAINKFVHRDLAARNCMLDDQMNVKVADFGLCRNVYEKGYYRSDNKKKLPIRWMAVESIENGTYTPKSDVWSLGIVFWEMTTRGTTPYPGVEGWDILRYLVAGRRLDQPYFCPDALYALMERCWRTQPIDRPTFRDIVQDVVNLTDALQVPAAANAVCVDTLISFPDCHRFKDDESILLKVKAAMRNMSQERCQAASNNTSNTNSPQLSPTALLDTSTASSSVFGPSTPDSTPTTTTTNNNNNNNYNLHHRAIIAAGASSAGAFPFPTSTTSASTETPATASAPGSSLCDPRACPRPEESRRGKQLLEEGGEAIPMRVVAAAPAATSANSPASPVVRRVEGSLDPTGQWPQPLAAGMDAGYFVLERQEAGADDDYTALSVSSSSCSIALPESGSRTGLSGSSVGMAQSASSPLISRHRHHQQQDHQQGVTPEGERSERNRPAVSFYNRQHFRDTTGKDDGYQYFELEREDVESSNL